MDEVYLYMGKKLVTVVEVKDFFEETVTVHIARGIVAGYVPVFRTREDAIQETGGCSGKIVTFGE